MSKRLFHNAAQLVTKSFHILISPAYTSHSTPVGGTWASLTIGAFPLHGMVRYGSARYGTVRYGTAQFGSVCVSTAV